MKRDRNLCIHHRNDDGCSWCELGKTCADCMVAVCSSYEKRITKEEAERVTDLMKVWDYLYNNKVYDLCDFVSKEIGIIKGVEVL